MRSDDGWKGGRKARRKKKCESEGGRDGGM